MVQVRMLVTFARGVVQLARDLGHVIRAAGGHDDSCFQRGVGAGAHKDGRHTSSAVGRPPLRGYDVAARSRRRRVSSMPRESRTPRPY